MRLQGGPYAGHEKSFHTNGSLTFTARGMTGFYSRGGVWHNTAQVVRLRPAPSVLEGTDRTTEGTIGQP